MSGTMTTNRPTAQRYGKANRYKVRLKIGRHVQDEPDADTGKLVEVNHFQGDVFYSEHNLAAWDPGKFERADDYQNLTGDAEGDLESLQRMKDELDAKIADLRSGSRAADRVSHNLSMAAAEQLEQEILQASENPVKTALLQQGGRIARVSDGSGDLGGDPGSPLKLADQPSKPGTVPVNAKPLAADAKAKQEALERLNVNDLKRLCQNNLVDGKPAPIQVPPNATKADLVRLLS